MDLIGFNLINWFCDICDFFNVSELNEPIVEEVIIESYNHKLKKNERKTVLSFVNPIDQNKFYNAVLNGAAGSWQFKNRFPTMIKNQFDFGFSTELMAKDLKYILTHAKKMNVELNLTTKAFKLYKKLSISKFKNQDTSSILNLIWNIGLRVLIT